MITHTYYTLNTAINRNSPNWWKEEGQYINAEFRIEMYQNELQQWEADKARCKNEKSKMQCDQEIARCKKIIAKEQALLRNRK